MSFRARHSAARKIQASFIKQASPFNSYGLAGQSFILTTTMATYSIDQGPVTAFAYWLRARAFAKMDEAGKALTDIDMALK